MIESSFENMLRAFVRRTKTTQLNKWELEAIADRLLKTYNKERTMILEIRRGKGDLIIEYVGDTIITKKPQKDDNGNIKWITMNINKWEVEKMYLIIKNQWKNKINDYIESVNCYQEFTGIDKSIFQSKRTKHNKLNRILQILAQEDKIEYKRSGRIYLK